MLDDIDESGTDLASLELNEIGLEICFVLGLDRMLELVLRLRIVLVQYDAILDGSSLMEAGRMRITRGRRDGMHVHMIMEVISISVHRMIGA
jgi:hypothetical protein